MKKSTTPTSTLLQIAQLGNPVLRKKAKPVQDINDENIQELIDDLIASMRESDGVGIAAPQVYRSERLFIIASAPSKSRPNAPAMKPVAVINPQILAVSEKVEYAWEGCLSIPGIRAVVPRPVSVDVEYTTREGKQVKKKLKEFVARIFLHEYDHLDGIVFLDRVEDTRDIMTEKEYLKMVEKESRKVKESKSPKVKKTQTKKQSEQQERK